MIQQNLLSTTYQKVPCTDPLCRRSGYVRIYGECKYQLRYIGHRSTKGIASRDTFTFQTKDKKPVPAEGILFGCSAETDPDFPGNFRVLSGSLGLGKYPESLPSQMGGCFSYCLSSVFQSSPAVTRTSFLRFGADIPTIPPRWDIRFGGHRVGFPLGTFKSNRDGTGGFRLDNGASFTYLNPTPYSRLGDELGASIAALRFKKVKRKKGFELWYEYKTEKKLKDLPTMSFHFGHGGDLMPTESLYVVYRDKKPKALCVALHEMSNPAPNLRGAYQLQETLVIHDLNQKELSFAPTTNWRNA